MLTITLCAIILSIVSAIPLETQDNSVHRLIQYRGFSLWYNCKERTADRYAYVIGKDTGKSPRFKKFFNDPNLPDWCLQQTSTEPYRGLYDRGHLVTANHVDSDLKMIKESNYMTNVVPQIKTLNQGIVVEGERIAECYRDLNPVHIYGGVVYTDSSNDIFLESHGIKTPDFFWKVMVTKIDQKVEVLSWFIPNTETANDYPLEKYIVSVKYIESRLNDGLGPIDVADNLKGVLPKSNWPRVSGCRLG